MIYSGIDWSGDPGDPRTSTSPLLVVGLAHIDGARLQDLTSALSDVRSRQQLGPRFPFKFAKCSDLVRRAFFAGIAAVDVEVHLAVIDKHGWYPAPPGTRPHRLLDEAVANLVAAVPAHVVAGQVLLIDLPRSETKVVRRMESAVRQALRARGVRPWPEVKPCPDTRTTGEIVQVADMFAGAVHDDGAAAHWLNHLRHRYRVV